MSDTKTHVGEAPASLRPARRPLRVLLAEDDENVRSLVALNLEFAGYQIVGEAADGAEALNLTQMIRPDVLLLDMMMFPVSGSDVLRALAATPKRDLPTVVAFSAAPRELEAALDLGADRAVLKDGDFDVLLDVLDSLWESN